MRTKKNITSVIDNNSKDICTISSVVPYYQYSNIDIKVSDDDVFYLYFPSDIAIQYNIDISKFKKDDIIGVNIDYEKLGVEESHFWSILEKERHNVAKNFSLRDNGMYFNGEKYGVLYSDGFGRTVDKVEEPILFIKLFKTDYYTQMVIERTLKNINIKNKIDLNFLNHNMCGLRMSLGVSIILYIPNSNEILLTRRSKYVSYNDTNKEWIYVSVTESFTETDYDEFQKSPDLIFCIQRGLKEELGIDKNIIKYIKIYDMFFEKNFFQDGILAFVCLNNYITYDNIINLKSKDKHLEISRFIPLKNSKSDICKFIMDNKDDMRPQTKYALENYVERMEYLNQDV